MQSGGWPYSKGWYKLFEGIASLCSCLLFEHHRNRNRHMLLMHKCKCLWGVCFTQIRHKLDRKFKSHACITWNIASCRLETYLTTRVPIAHPWIVIYSLVIGHKVGFNMHVTLILAAMNTWVCQDLLCSSYVIEHLLSLFFVLSFISIWMPLPGQFTISFINFSLSSRSV